MSVYSVQRHDEEVVHRIEADRVVDAHDSDGNGTCFYLGEQLVAQFFGVIDWWIEAEPVEVDE